MKELILKIGNEEIKIYYIAGNEPKLQDVANEVINKFGGINTRPPGDPRR